MIAILKGIYLIPWALSDIDMMHYQNKGVYHTVSWNFLTILRNGMRLLNLELIIPHIWSFLILKMYP